MCSAVQAVTLKLGLGCRRPRIEKVYCTWLPLCVPMTGC